MPSVIHYNNCCNLTVKGAIILIVMDQIPFNPYIVGNPIKTKDMFFGREDDFQFVARKIGEARSNQILVFCGERRSGKTSILFQILGGRLGERFLPVLIDMQILAGIKDDLHFFRTIIKVACNSLKLPGLSIEYLEESSRSHTIEELFDNFLRFVEKHFENRIILFLLDEYELIEEKIRDKSLSESSIHYLSGVLESMHRVSFIFTGSTNLENRKVSFWKSLLGKSIYRKISYLSQKDTFRLITEPLKKCVKYPEEIKKSIYRLTAGQPFYTQVICQNIVDHLIEERRNDPVEKDLESIVKDIIDNPLPQMIYSWNSLSGGNKLILSSLGGLLSDPEDWAEASGIHSFFKKNKILLPFKKEQIHILLEEAYHQEFLEKTDHKYRFRMDLLRRWIKREHSIWKVAKEIKLEFRKRLNPALVIGLSAVLVFAAIAAWLFTPWGPSLLSPKELKDSLSPATVQAVPEEFNNITLMSNLGPFRVAVDDSLNLTSEGQDDEKMIILPGLKKGDHNFSFYNPASDEKIQVAADINRNGQIIQVNFTLLARAGDKSRDTSVQKIEKNTGSLFISSIPTSASIILDGKDTGLQTPSLFENIKDGNHRITLIRVGFKDETIDLVIEKNKTLKREVILAESFGELLFDVRPTAIILLDGSPLIETPYVKPVSVRCGKHTLTIINESLGVRKEIEIELTEGQSIKIVEVLK